MSNLQWTQVILAVGLAWIIYEISLFRKSFKGFLEELREWKADLAPERTLTRIIEDGITNALKMATLRDPRDEPHPEALDIDFFDKVAQDRGVLTQILLALYRR
jgi:hypothetical protein